MDVLAPEARSQFFMAVFLLGMQQLSGIDGVLYVITLSPILIFKFPHLRFDSTLPFSSGKLVLVSMATRS